MPRHHSKRFKTSISFGAPSADDRRIPAESNPSSSAFSVRTIKEPRPPTLASLCIRIFTRCFAELSDEDHWDVTRKWIKILPDSVLPPLFAALKVQHPRRMNHAVVTTYFLRGTSVSLSGDLAITLHTLAAIPRVLGKKLVNLELSDFDKFSDSTYATMIRGLPSLTTLVLRNCLKVGPSTVEGIATCRHVTKIDLSFTSVTASSLLPVIKECAELEVLKLAGVQNLSDATISKLFSSITDGDEPEDHKPLIRLTSLKLRHTTISEVALSHFLHLCTNLKKLDVSFTLVKHISHLTVAPSIEKLSLTSTFVPGKELVELVAGLPRLKVLNVGAMGVKASTSSTVASSTAMTLNDDVLRQLTDAFRGCDGLQRVNLVQNSKLGATRRPDNAIAYFIRHIGKKLLYLNLSGLAVRSEDLVGLIPETQDDQVSPLETLILNKSLVDDECAPWISSCQSLQALELSETRISEEGLYQIIDSCPKLSKLNLTGCRGVRIADRRRFFDAWEEHRTSKT